MTSDIHEELRLRAQIERTTAEWNRTLQQMKSALARHDEPIQRPDMSPYIQRRISEERDTIAPELIDYIGGNSIEEVEKSIAIAREKTASILRAAVLQTPANSPAQPPQQQQQEYTAEQIAAMSPQSPQYGALRQAFGMDKAGRGRGLFD